MLGRLAVLIALALALVAPAAAAAADVSVSGGVLRYAATPGAVNNVSFTEKPAGTVTVERGLKDVDPLVAGTGCRPGPAAASVTCTGVVQAEIDVGDMSDRVTATFEPPDAGGLINIPAAITGGAGNDALTGGARNDLIDGGAGDDDLDGSSGNDSLRGGDGDDILQPDNGTDVVTGGDGIDTARYGVRIAPTYTLDGLANDGDAGENDLIGSDVENVEGAAALDAAIVTMVGDGRANHLKVTQGVAVLTGGEGSDVLEGGPQDDTLNSRDGSPDTLICNGGTDTALVDTLDTVSSTCENVQTQAMPGGPFDDHPPVIAWTAPAAGVSLSANAPTMLAVDASDDRGLSRVQFFDDDRLVCEDATAPYACAYQPRGGDVGRDTLIAVAVDGAGQTSSTVRAVVVRRFTPRGLGLALRPSRDRRAPYAFRATGRLLRPTTVSPSQGCTGTVTLTAKAGGNTVATRRLKLSRTCAYAVNVSFRTRPASRLRFTAEFGGNEVLAARTSSSRSARLK